MKLNDQYIRDLAKYKDITINQIEISDFPFESACLYLEAVTKSNKSFGIEYRHSRKKGMFLKTNVDMFSEHDGDIFMYKSYTGEVGSFRDCWFFRHSYNGKTVHNNEIYSLDVLQAHLKSQVSPEGYMHFMELIDFLDIDHLTQKGGSGET